MSNCLRWAPQLASGEVVLPFPGVANATTHPDDIAAVVVVLTDDGHGDQAYLLSGPEALLLADQIQIVGEMLGRASRYVPQRDEDARAQMLATTPAAIVEATFDVDAGAALHDSILDPTVEQVTGSPPRPLRDRVSARRNAFRVTRDGPGDAE